MPDTGLRKLLLLQALYYLLTGIWPLVHLKSFLAVTGPKTDIWILKTLSLLISVVGATLLASAVHNRITPEQRILAGGSAVALGSADLYYVARRTISPIYLLDGVVELILGIFWTFRRPEPATQEPNATSISTSVSFGSRPKNDATSSS